MPKAPSWVGQINTQWQWGKRKLALVVVSLVLILSVTQTGFAWQVLLNGEEVGIVKDKEALVALIDESTREVQETSGLEVGLASEVEFKKVFSLSTDSVQTIKETLGAELEFGLQATSITVNGTKIAALGTIEEAQTLLEELKARFMKTTGNVEVESIKFLEAVELQATYSKVEDIVDKEAALNTLLYGSEKTVQHIVGRGESFWTVASRYKLSVSALQAANPSIKPELLQIGAKLNLQVAEPLVHVEVVQRQTFNQSIPFTTTYTTDDSLWTWDSRVQVPGQPGTQQVTVRIVKVNGKEERRDTLETRVIASPVARVVARGTKTAPSLSTGSFVWPTTGTVTSPYGSRWGSFHAGVDIGAPQGTVILAADSGTVVFSGWNGGYGYMVKIDHGNGTSTLYAHSSKLLVSKGAFVEKGQAIALVGNTGNSYGAHLHFEIHVNGKHVNPLGYFR